MHNKILLTQHRIFRFRFYCHCLNYKNNSTSYLNLIKVVQTFYKIKKSKLFAKLGMNVQKYDSNRKSKHFPVYTEILI